MQEKWSNKKIIGLCAAVIYMVMSMKVIFFHPELIDKIVYLTGMVFASYFGFKHYFDSKNGKK